MRIASRQYRDAAQLAEIERQLALVPRSTLLRFERACALEDLGWDEAASAAYAEILADEPQHLGARTNLGMMVHERGDLQGAGALLADAVARYPLAPIAHANLAKNRFEAGETERALAHYRRALELDPTDFPARHGLALAYETLGDAAAAAHHFGMAFADRAWWTLPYLGTAPAPPRVLLLMSGRGGDVVTHPFLDDRLVATTMLVPDGVAPGTALPPHDVVFNGIGDADRCRASLERAVALLPAEGGTINHPARVLATGRTAVAARLAGIANVVVPRMERVAREALVPALPAARGWTYPLLVRSFGHHAGRYLALVRDDLELVAARDAIPGAELLAIGFVETRGADGWYRKYRALFVDGRWYAVHVAIARDWNVHYFDAGMEANAAHRAEDARFLDDPAAAIGSKAVAALERIGDALALDYGGVDFALDGAGRVVVFEANATMAVSPPPPGDVWSYRRPSYERIVGAVRAMVNDRAHRNAP